MNRKELEKMFDEKFPNLSEEEMYMDWGIGYMEKTEEVKEFIFDELIKEALKSIIPENKEWEPCNFFNWYNRAIDIIKENAKAIYDITL